MKALSDLMARVRPSDEESFDRFRRWLTEDFEIDESEQLLVGSDATFYPHAWRHSIGTLYLTNQRLLFKSLYGWPRDKLQVRLMGIDGFGSDVPWHVALGSFPFAAPWVVEAQGVSYYFATGRDARKLFLEQLADLITRVRDNGP